MKPEHRDDSRLGREARHARGRRSTAAFAALFLTFGVAASAQSPPTHTRAIALAEALELGREGNVDLRVAATRVEARNARVRGASAALLPRVDIESGWLRTVDPVAAFGAKLRQTTFGPDDLAIPVLNEPDALTDWTTSAVARWSVLSPTSWADRATEEHRAVGARWTAERVRERTDLETRTLYYRALQAEARVEAARAAERAAEATLERFQRRRGEGMLTTAEVLQARAELEAASANRIGAERTLHEARLRLGLHLGWGPDTLPLPTDSLPEPEAVRRERGDLRSRPDLRAREAALEAARSHRTRARLAWAPTLDLMTAYSLHDDTPFSDQGTDWTVGLTLRWNLFSGLGRTAASREASAGLAAQEMEYDQALREARGEVETALGNVEASRTRLEASRAARDAAREGRRLMRRRFEEGLATASDLLQAEARATTMEVRAVDALAEYHIARARLRFVRSLPGTEETPGDEEEEDR